jgi:hypothetical protein
MKTCGQCKQLLSFETRYVCLAKLPIWAVLAIPGDFSRDMRPDDTKADWCACFAPKEDPK